MIDFAKEISQNIFKSNKFKVLLLNMWLCYNLKCIVQYITGKEL